MQLCPLNRSTYPHGHLTGAQAEQEGGKLCKPPPLSRGPSAPPPGRHWYTGTLSRADRQDRKVPPPPRISVVPRPWKIRLHWYTNTTTREGSRALPPARGTSTGPPTGGSGYTGTLVHWYWYTGTPCAKRQNSKAPPLPRCPLLPLEDTGTLVHHEQTVRGAINQAPPPWRDHAGPPPGGCGRRGRTATPRSRGGRRAAARGCRGGPRAQWLRQLKRLAPARGFGAKQVKSA